MFASGKLRPDTSVTGIIQPVIALLIFAVFWALYGIGTGILSMAFIFGIYALLSLAYLLRTGNPWFTATFIYQLTVIIFILLAPKVGVYALPEESFKPLVLILFLELAVMVYIMATKKLKWRGRAILEIAAQNINEVTNGFTERPRPMGKIDCNSSELAGFADFLKSNLIAYPIRESGRMVIVPIMMGDDYRIPLGFSDDYSNDTWVALDDAGNVSAFISKKDYLKYKEALAFDQLCDSLGNTFIRYFDQYKKGEGVRIMHELNKVKTGPFS